MHFHFTFTYYFQRKNRQSQQKYEKNGEEKQEECEWSNAYLWSSISSKIYWPGKPSNVFEKRITDCPAGKVNHLCPINSPPITQSFNLSTSSTGFKHWILQSNKTSTALLKCITCDCTLVRGWGLYLYLLYTRAHTHPHIFSPLHRSIIDANTRSSRPVSHMHVYISKSQHCWS